MKAENKWEEAVREKLTGMEKNLPEGDWSEFLAISKARKNAAVKVAAIIFGCCVAAAIASFIMLPRLSTNREYKSSDIPQSLLAESTTQKPASPEKINNEQATPIIPHKRCPQRHIPESSGIVETPEERGKKEPPEAVNSPEEETASKDPVSRHASDPEDTLTEIEDDNDGKRTGGHGVSISMLGTGVRASSINRTGFGGINDGTNEISGAYEYTHRRPVTFGMTVSYGLTSRLSIVSGLEYSRYSSSINYLKDNISAKQCADYLGIPIRIDYQALRSNHFAVYTGAGLKADWCVKASCAGEKLTDKGLNWTACATVGAQYEILRGISVYIEPEISYFLNNGDQKLRTYRTENPLMVSAVLGLRLSLGSER